MIIFTDFHDPVIQGKIIVYLRGKYSWCFFIYAIIPVGILNISNDLFIEIPDHSWLTFTFKVSLPHDIFSVLRRVVSPGWTEELIAEDEQAHHFLMQAICLFQNRVNSIWFASVHSCQAKVMTFMAGKKKKRSDTVSGEFMPP